MEDETLDTQSENETEETVNEDEQTVEDETNDEDEALNQKYLDQRRRAEKAEAELKALKEKSEKQPAKADKPQKSTSQDETFIIAALSSKGMSYTDIDKYLDKAKKISQIEGIPLKEVLDNDYFKAFDKTYQEEKKRELASMGASKGSGGAFQKKTLQTPGLSDEEFNSLLKKELLG